MEIKTTKEIFEEAFVKDRLFWIDDSDKDVERICSMDNNLLNNVKWVKVDDVIDMLEGIRRRKTLLQIDILIYEFIKELKGD